MREFQADQFKNQHQATSATAPKNSTAIFALLCCSIIVFYKVMASSNQTQLATFAAGCFWGVELAFYRVPGVVRVGYMAFSYCRSPVIPNHSSFPLIVERTNAMESCCPSLVPFLSFVFQPCAVFSHEISVEIVYCLLFFRFCRPRWAIRRVTQKTLRTTMCVAKRRATLRQCWWSMTRLW